jgi:hypothetical protein
MKAIQLLTQDYEVYTTLDEPIQEHILSVRNSSSGKCKQIRTNFEVVGIKCGVIHICADSSAQIFFTDLYDGRVYCIGIPHHQIKKVHFTKDSD